MIGENQPTDKNQSIHFLQFVHYWKAQIQKLIVEHGADGPYANSEMKSMMKLGLEDDIFLKWSKKFKQIWKILHPMEAAGFCNTSLNVADL